ITQLEKRGLVARTPCPKDRRATNITLTSAGWEKMVQAAPGHVNAVRRLVLDALDPEQVTQLSAISAAMLTRLDPDGRMLVTSRPDSTSAKA
ncbi:MAG: MarR family transcriptional regulator, partial [Propionibacterium sp.]|nr:MarR family transcriptional regulator [Propionibacterium sp.]